VGIFGESVTFDQFELDEYDIPEKSCTDEGSCEEYQSAFVGSFLSVLQVMAVEAESVNEKFDSRGRYEAVGKFGVVLFISAESVVIIPVSSDKDDAVIDKLFAVEYDVDDVLLDVVVSLFGVVEKVGVNFVDQFDDDVFTVVETDDASVKSSNIVVSVLDEV